MNKPFLRGSLISSVILLVSLALPALVMRSVLLYERGWLSVVDVPGLGGDLLVGAVVAAALFLVGRRFKYLAVVAAVLLALLAVGNYENIRVLGSNLNLTYVSYLADGTFLAGSGSSLAHPVISIFIVCFSVFSAFLWTRPRFQIDRSYVPLFGAMTLGVVALTFNVGGDLTASWRRENVVVASLTDLWARATINVLSNEVDTTALLRSDLSGTPIIDYAGSRPNVLLVVLESVSGAFLPSFRESAGLQGGDEISMPLLDKIAGEGLSYSLFLANQRQTNRGTFTVLCGRLPKLTSATAKMTEYAEKVVSPKCLPELLRDAGYNTSYVQAASTGFMNKEVFMSLAGFDTVLGDVWPDVAANSRSGWGVDDKTFFDIASQHIRELQKAEQPWFLTLLTSGTHHPYTVPEDYRPSIGRDIASYEYLDEGLDTFIRGLEAQDVLEDTLVIITSDESAGIKGVEDSVDVFLSQSWSFAVVLLPGDDKPRRSINEPFSQSDLALTVADYLNVPMEGWPFMGRSMFRSYGTGRPIFMGNTYAQRQLALFPDSLLVCNESRWDCRSLDLSAKHHIVAAVSTSKLDMEHVRLLKAVAELAESSPASKVEVAPVRLVRPDASFRIASPDETQIFAGPRFLVPANHRVNVEFDVEVAGSGVIQLSHFFKAAKDDPFEYSVPIPALSSGDRFSIRYSVDFLEKQRVDLLRLNARRLGGDADAVLKVHEARYSVLPSDTLGEPSGTVVRLVESQVEYQPASGTITMDLSQDGAFRWPDCVVPGDGGIVVEGCGPRHVIFGPYFTAPAGSDIDFSYEAEVIKGDAFLNADIVSGFGSNHMARSDSALLRSGETFAGTVSTKVAGPKAVSNIETRLFMEPGGDGASVSIRNLLVKVTPNAEDAFQFIANSTDGRNGVGSTPPLSTHDGDGPCTC